MHIRVLLPPYLLSLGMLLSVTASTVSTVLTVPKERVVLNPVKQCTFPSKCVEAFLFSVPFNLKSQRRGKNNENREAGDPSSQKWSALS